MLENKIFFQGFPWLNPVEAGGRGSFIPASPSISEMLKRGNIIFSGNTLQHSWTLITNRIHSKTLSNTISIFHKNFQSTQCSIFKRNLKNFTNDPAILELVQDYTIHFISYQKQSKPLSHNHVKKGKKVGVSEN